MIPTPKLMTILSRCRVNDPPRDQIDFILEGYIADHKITPFCRKWKCPSYLIAALISSVETRKQIELKLQNDKLVWKADPETWKKMSETDWDNFLAENWANETTGNERQGIECFRNPDALITYCGFSPKFGYKKGNKSLNLILSRSKIGTVDEIREFLHNLYKVWSENNE